MLTWAWWVSLVLAVSTLVAWAVVSGLRLAYQGPSFAEMMTHGAPRRITDPRIYIIELSMSHAALRRADVALLESTAEADRGGPVSSFRCDDLGDQVGRSAKPMSLSNPPAASCHCRPSSS
jgi:hypothetical protein